MISKNYTFKIKCDAPECNDGIAEYDRDSFNGPYAVEHECWECEGKGYHQTFEDHYSSEAELQKDYLDAFDIEVVNGRYHKQSVSARVS